MSSDMVLLIVENKGKNMKKYILSTMIVSMLVMTNMAVAMEKEKKQMPQTSLSEKQVAELRKAVVDYKNDRSRATQEKVINKYKKQYPNDPFVKAKLNEKARFDNPEQPVKKVQKESAKPQVKKEPAKKQRAKKEVNAVKTSLTAKQQAELNAAVQGIKDKPLSESRKEQLVILEYGNKYSTDKDESNYDPFVKAKIYEAHKAYNLKKYGPNHWDPDHHDSEDDTD